MRKKLLISFCALLFAITAGLAQTTTVTGKVTDDKGTPLAGASVLEKGTKNGVSADANGAFTIKVKTGATLIVSEIGFETTQVSAKTSNLIIKLNTDTKSLSEVVVTGSGIATTRSKLGISVESIKGDKLPVIPSAGIDQALVGKIAGAQISSVSGNPGDQVNIVLRGINSVQGGTRPMILLDGIEIPFSSLNILDLTQVDRIEVVQGAASSSLYGAQGANGVIQIFTKKGTRGSVKVDVSSSVGLNTYINAGNFKKADKHPYLTDANGNIVSALNSGGFTAGQSLSIDPNIGALLGSGTLAYRYGTNIAGLPAGFTTPGGTANYTRYGILDPRNTNDQSYKGSLQYYDHFSQVFQSGLSRNNSVTFSGGGEKNDFSITLSNNNIQSALLKDNGGIDRTNLVVNVGFELFKNFTIRSITNIVYTNNTMHPQLGGGGGIGYGYGTSNADVGGVYGFLNTSPFFNLMGKDADGNYVSYQRASFASVNAFNPFYRLQYTSNDDKRIDFLTSLQANYRVNRFVTLDARYGISYRNENAIWTYFNQSLNQNSNFYQNWAAYNNGNDNTGEINNFQYFNTKQNFYSSANAKFDFDKDLKLRIPIQSTTLVAFDYRKNKYKEYDTWGQTLPLNPPFNAQSTQQQFVMNDYVEPFVTYGYIVDQKFDWGNHAGVSGGFRTDYSSTFGAGSKPFTFGHYNGYVNLHTFNFWSGLSNVISAFKIRGGWGQAGIQPGAFQRNPVLNLQQTGNEVTYTNQTTSRNPNLNVEVSTETEIGTDFTINANNKGNWLRNINVNFTYWKRSTDNAIFSQNVPPSTGASRLLTNAIGLSSNGIQIGINIPVYASKNFTWDFTANFGHQKSIITSVSGGDIPLTTAAGSSGLVLTAGAPIGQIYGYKALTSIDQTRADGTPFIAAANKGNYEIVNGRVVNKLTKAIFFSDEATPFGDPNPKLTSSYINSFTYKGAFSFGFQFDWIYGSHLYNQTNEWMYRDGISGDFTNPVTINGQTGAYTAYYASAYYALGTTARGVGNNTTKDYFYSDASFVRLRNVSFGVDFAKLFNLKWTKKCQLVLSGRNLLTITKYGGMDPEVSSGASNSAFDRGIDHSTIPNLKAFQATLNLGF